MPFPTMNVKDGNGIIQTPNTLPNAGRVSAADSLPTVLSTEDNATLVDIDNGIIALEAATGTTSTAAAGDTGGSSVIGFLRYIRDKLSAALAVTLNPTIFNDTTTVLAAGATFTGTMRDAGASPIFRSFAVTISTDQASAAGGAIVQMSDDAGANWYDAAVAGISAGVPGSLSTPVVARYYRVKYTNGATLQVKLKISSAFFRT